MSEVSGGGKAGGPSIADASTRSGSGGAGAGGTAGNSGADASTAEGAATQPVAARLTLAPAPSSSSNFGSVLVGESSDRLFVVANAGQQPSSAISIQLAPGGSEFSLLEGLATDCQNAVTTLAGGAACNVRVHFAPSSSAAGAATLAVSATRGGMPPALTLSANGQRPASLSGSAAGAFRDAEIGATSTAAAWEIRNDGDFPTNAPTLANSNPSEIVVLTNGCTTPIAAGSSCTISVAVKPSASGDLAGTLAVTAGPAGTVTYTVSARGVYRITVVKAGTGAGRVTSAAARLDCGASCSALVPAGGIVPLQARTTNGSDSRFTGWSVPDCSGPIQDCTFALNASTTVTATFVPMTNNVIFVTSMRFPSDLGGTAPYDRACNTAATDAGINSLSGTDYIAFMSDASSSASSRLGSARGWVRMDNKPFADLQSSIFARQAILNPIRFNELGANVTFAGFGLGLLTGTNADGTFATDLATIGSRSCNNWTSTSVGYLGGSSEGGPFGWTAASNSQGCVSGGNLICMGRSKTAAVSPVVTPGKKIWLSNSPFLVGGAQTPNAQCQAERPPGVTAAAALIATTGAPASAVLDLLANYVRPDGTLVGTGAEIAGGKSLQSGIWQSADSAYRPFNQQVWTGQTAVTQAGTLDSTCSNWTDAALTAVSGHFTSADSSWWKARQFSPCSDPNVPIYCVQTAP